MTSKLEGQIWLTADQPGGTLARAQIKLLSAIEATGSISGAARELGISYRTAWERLDRMNNLSEHALVSRSAGGSQGGGSQLTEHGKNILEGFSRLEQAHREFIARLGERVEAVDDLAGFVRSSQWLSSAGNQFLGSVASVKPGAVNAEVTLTVNQGVSLVAIITEQSRVNLGARSGQQLIALIKASSVLLSRDSRLAVSARNVISGRIRRVVRGKVNTDVFVDIGDNKTLNSVVTNPSADRLELVEDLAVTAFFKASSVILLRG